MSPDDIKIIVPGGLNTDIVAVGVERLLGSGELARGQKVKIGPGGKSRNIAQMIAALLGQGKVAMIGRTSRDAFGLWKPPFTALEDAGVNTHYVKQFTHEESGEMPGIALIPVDTRGRNQIYLLPGINDTFSPSDVDEASPLFAAAQQNEGILALSLELPLATALRAVEKAKECKMRVVLDPGGMSSETDYGRLLEAGIDFVKPNVHETKMLTGIEVTGLASAHKAAGKLMQKGIAGVFITAGEKGAYIFTGDLEEHILIPEVQGEEKDETGCGDQTMAAFCALLAQQVKIEDAARRAVMAGTMQFQRIGIQPVTWDELNHNS